ncbi:hypothetical protein VE04_02840 [Pseudogymnoascus sp. 24MN13]|nr:hypothetical protein VE04_02840 [Pseudogymnoascus sp. 24MN13]
MYPTQASNVPHEELKPNATDLHASVTANETGRVDVAFEAKSPQALKSLPAFPPTTTQPKPPRDYQYPVLPLNIVIQIVGSRGDVQPFLALAQELQHAGHCIRIATHDVFEDFVKQSGLEFWPIGGDPSQLMAYMVKNPGIIPKFQTILDGEIGRKQKMMADVLEGCWKSCIEPDLLTGRPFVADAIIANPPSYAHVHCAQALGVPLHLMFTMPWTPTRYFPHPLANIQRSNIDPHTANYLSYGMVETMTWQGLGNLTNDWRKKTLGLDPIPTTMGASLLEFLEVPFTYCWSPALVAKPEDWPGYIDVCGFFFRRTQPYTPPADLVAFLDAGPAPIYIGFGSIVIEDPAAMTDLILEAVASCGIRALISRGWSNLGEGKSQKDVFFLGDCPHDWLFGHVTAVMHHGGAGTTACGLLNGKPTSIVPFFGDQQFWGNMVASAGAGPHPIPYKALTVEKAVAAIEILIAPATKVAAAKIASKMKTENGVREAAASFHHNLPMDKMQCDFLPGKVACWSYKKGKKQFKLSYDAALILIDEKLIDTKDLHLYHVNEISINNKRWDPFTATSSALLRMVTDVSIGVSDMVIMPAKAYQGGGVRSVGTTSAKGAAKMVGSVVKGSLVTVPVALTDGLHQLPALYGDKPRDNGQVNDWKSGGKVAGKTFVWGFLDGIAGVVVDPCRGAMEGGAKGLMAGMVQGSMGLVTKPSAGMFGLLAYPALGIYKSLKGMSETQEKILAARHLLATYEKQHGEKGSDQARSRVIQKFGKK